MRLHFVRHGESTANLTRQFSKSAIEHPLTATGVAQAQALAERLAGLRVAQIYSSPVRRAVETARILAERLHAPLALTDALREWSVGIYEGTTDPAGWDLHRQVQEDWFFRHQLDSKMPGGESFLEIRERFVPFIDELVRAGGHTAQEIVLVGHGGLYLAMLPAILQNVDVDFALQQGFPYTAWVVAETRPDGLYCVSWDGAAPGA